MTIDNFIITLSGYNHYPCIVLGPAHTGFASTYNLATHRVSVFAGLPWHFAGSHSSSCISIKQEYCEH
jgi:hypothetical protein